MRFLPPNPLRSENAAFSFLLWVVAVLAVAAVIAIVARAIA